MLANPSMTQKGIAATVGVSPRTVARVISRLKNDEDEIGRRVNRYKTLLDKRLPLTKRVEYIGDIAAKSPNDFARLKAIERADLFDGIDFRPKPQEEQPRQPVAMFNLPGDAKVQVNIGCQLTESDKTCTTIGKSQNDDPASD
jgi:hypothetical protein